MTIVYYNDLIGNLKFNDIRNYSTDQAGITPRVVNNSITAFDTGQPIGSMTITVTTNVSSRFRTLPARIFVENNVGLGADVMLTVNTIVGTLYTVDEDITGIDVSGTAERVDIGSQDELRFMGTGAGGQHDTIIDGPELFPFNDECFTIRMLEGEYNGRIRIYGNGTRKLLSFDQFGNNFFTIERGFDRTFAGEINYAASWLWTFVASHFGDIFVGPEVGSDMRTSLDSPFIGPDIGNDGTTQLLLIRRDTSLPLWYQPLKSQCIIDTPDNGANINIEGINLVLQFPDGVQYLQGTTAEVIVSSGGTINVGPFQKVFASTNTVNASTLPTDKDELWLPPIYFVHDWNGSYQIQESFETHIRTSQNGTETRREIVDKPYRNFVQASQAWTPSEILLMQALFNRMGSARTLQPIWSDMVHTLQEITPTTPPFDSARYPDILTLPANGTSFPIDPSREDVRWRRFYKGMRVLIYDLTKQPFTRMVSVFEIAIVDRVWGEYDLEFPNTYGTIWFTAPLVNTYPKGTRIIPLVETQIKLDNDSRIVNAKVARFPVRMLEDVGRMALPAIIPGGLINDDNANDIFVNPQYATVPSWYGSSNAPAAPILEPKIANWATTPRRKFNRPGQFTKVGRGTIPEIYGNRILNDYSFLNSSLSREKAWALITMFHSRCGRTNRVYIVNPYEDYVATVLTAVSVTIAKGAEGVDIITRPYIAFKLDYEDAFLIRNIVSSTDNGSTLTLTWVNPLPRDNGVITIADLNCIRSAFLSRFKKDDLIQNMLTHNVMEVGMQFQDIGPEINEGLSSVSGEWEIDQTKGTDGLEIIHDEGEFITTINSQTVSSNTEYGTAEEAVRALIDFQLDTNSTCTPLNIFWPVDETFELLRIVYVNVVTDIIGGTFVDIGYGERGNCEDNDYDFNNFVIRVYLTYLGALWNHREPATEGSNIPCPRPFPKDFSNFFDMSEYVETPEDNFSNVGTATLKDLVETTIDMDQYQGVTQKQIRVWPQVSMPDGIGIGFAPLTRSGASDVGWFQRTTKFPNEYFTFAGYCCAPYFLSGNDIDRYFISQHVSIFSSGFYAAIRQDTTPSKSNELVFFVNYNVGAFTIVAPVPTFEPFHYVIVAGEFAVQIYINGELAAETTFTSRTVDTTGGTFFSVGGTEQSKSATVKDFIGMLGGSLLRYSRAVTADEAKALFLHFSWQNSDVLPSKPNFYMTEVGGGGPTLLTTFNGGISFDVAEVSVANAYSGMMAIYPGNKPKQVQWTFTGDVSKLRVGWTNAFAAATLNLGDNTNGVGIGIELSSGDIRFKNAVRHTFSTPIVAGDILDIAIDPNTGVTYWRLNGNDGTMWRSDVSLIDDFIGTFIWLTMAWGTENPSSSGTLNYEVDPSEFTFIPILANTTVIPSSGVI